MHIIDILFTCVAVVFTIIGIKRGLITEAFRLLALIAGIALAALFYPSAARILEVFDMPGGARVALAFVSVFIAVLLSVLAVGWFVRRVVHLTVLGWVDRVCGACFGFAKVALLAWVFALAAAALPITAVQRRLDRSLVYRAFSRLPMRLRLPDTAAMRDRVEGMVEQQMRDIVPDKLQEFRLRVDSAKAALP